MVAAERVRNWRLTRVCFCGGGSAAATAAVTVLVLTARRAAGLEVGVKSVGEDMIIILIMGGEKCELCL